MIPTPLLKAIIPQVLEKAYGHGEEAELAKLIAARRKEAAIEEPVEREAVTPTEAGALGVGAIIAKLLGVTERDIGAFGQGYLGARKGQAVQQHQKAVAKAKKEQAQARADAAAAEAKMAFYGAEKRAIRGEKREDIAAARLTERERIKAEAEVKEQALGRIHGAPDALRMEMALREGATRGVITAKEAAGYQTDLLARQNKERQAGARVAVEKITDTLAKPGTSLTRIHAAQPALVQALMESGYDPILATAMSAAYTKDAIRMSVRGTTATLMLQANAAWGERGFIPPDVRKRWVAMYIAEAKSALGDIGGYPGADEYVKLALEMFGEQLGQLSDAQTGEHARFVLRLAQDKAEHAAEMSARWTSIGLQADQLGLANRQYQLDVAKAFLDIEQATIAGSFSAQEKTGLEARTKEMTKEIEGFDSKIRGLEAEYKRANPDRKPVIEGDLLNLKAQRDGKARLLNTRRVRLGDLTRLIEKQNQAALARVRKSLGAASSVSDAAMDAARSAFLEREKREPSEDELVAEIRTRQTASSARGLPGRGAGRRGLMGLSARGLENQRAGRQMAAGYGWNTGAEWDSLNALITKESGWSDTAANASSSARGIGQTMMSAHFGKNWKTNPKAQAFLNDPQAQINWALAYIKRRYGTPSKALAHHRQKSFY